VEDRASIASICARSGKAIFLDKPLAGNLPDGRMYRDALRQAGSANQMYSFTGLPWAKAAKECVDSGRIGDLRAVHAETMFAKGPGGSPPARADRTETPQPERYTFVEAKREFFDLGVYPIGLCLWLTGKRAIDVTAVTGNYFFGQHAGVDVEDFGVCVMRLEGDITATAVAGRVGYYSHPKGGPNRITLVGTLGTETFDAWTPRIEVYNAEASPVLPPPNPVDPMMMWRSTALAGGNPPKRVWDTLASESNWYPLDIRRFVDSLETGARPDITVEEAALSLEVLIAAYRSAASNSTVAIERL
jgi:predicted dehydrogenase